MVSMFRGIVFVYCFVNIEGFDNQYCEDLNPQSEINIAQITGVWFGVEYITHEKYSQQAYEYSSNYRNRLDDVYDCFVIEIKELDFEPTTSSYKYGPRDAGVVVPEQRYRHLVVQWDEPGNLLDYHVTFNMSRRGFWISSTPQNAGAPVAEMYKHFSGTIQVLKAVSNHLVLSFCMRLPEPKLFTVVLSRQQQRLDDMDIISIHGMLSRKRLSTSSVKKVCSGAVGINSSATYFFIAIFIGLFTS